MIAILLMMAVAVMDVLGVSQTHYYLSDDFIAELNKNATTWKAGRNFPADTPMKYLNSLGCAIPSDSSLPLKTHDLSMYKLPPTFDARKKWSKCRSLNEIRDQGYCGDCWAISPAETITDRQCIHKNEKFHASAVDIVSCCQNCYDSSACKSGYAGRAFDHYIHSGVVSGGSFGTKTGCKPYPKEVHDNLKVRKCMKKCIAGSKIKYKKDLRRGTKAYSVSGEQQMMAEIYTNGPIVVIFELFSDFYAYKKGVYKMTSGVSKGHHAVKVIGWGVESNVPYWLIANSWSAKWGDHGYFKILRGNNHCGIEGSAFTALP